MPRIFRSILTLLCLCVGTPLFAQAEAAADVPRGLWETAPDGAGVILHIRTRRCGRALCGRVERAKNRRGYDTPSDAVGEKVLWDLRPQADGSFVGEYRGPGGESFPDARVEVRGRMLSLRACGEAGCDTTIWTRIR